MQHQVHFRFHNLHKLLPFCDTFSGIEMAIASFNSKLDCLDKVTVDLAATAALIPSRSLS